MKLDDIRVLTGQAMDDQRMKQKITKLQQIVTESRRVKEGRNRGRRGQEGQRRGKVDDEA